MYDHSKHYLDDPAFSYMPMYSLDSGSADYSGMAYIAYGGKSAVIDIIIETIDFSYAENHQVTNHIGDTYSSVFFGKAPLELNVQASLPDSLENFGKESFMDAYKNQYRVSAVSRTGVMPELHCKGMCFKGPITKLTIVDDSGSCDFCTVVFTMLVMQMRDSGESAQVTFDYVTSLDSVTDIEAGAQTQSPSNSNGVVLHKWVK